MERETERCRQIRRIVIRPSWETEEEKRGLLWVEMAQKDWEEEKSLLCTWTSKMTVSCLCVSVPFLMHPPSLWPVNGRKIVWWPLTSPPPCLLGGPDNCYGNRMLLRWVDCLSRAASQPDESFDPACLLRSVLVALLWWHVCKLRVSFIAVMNRVALRMKCVVNM